MLHSRFKKFLAPIGITVSLFILLLALPPQVHAQTMAWTGVCVDAQNPDVATLQGIQCLVANILSIALTFLGMTSFVMVVIAILRRQFSGNNAQATEKSNTATFQAIAAIFVFLCSFIALNILSSFTGVTSILKFVIPDSDTCWPSGTRVPKGSACP